MPREDERSTAEPSGESGKRFFHVPVLLESSVENLVTKSGFYVDGTLGGGGHSEQILKTFAVQKFSDAKLFGIDQDDDAIRFATERLKGYKNFQVLRGNFSEMKTLLAMQGITQIDGLLLDLGISSFQIDAAERGFSFGKAARLDMRMNKTQPLTAETIVNDYDEKSLADVFYKYGEERKSRQLAKDICNRRSERRIETTVELAAILKRFGNRGEENKTLARLFQAIRIEVNGELDVLEKTLADAETLLAKGGRLVVMSYHSLEDRIVKNFLREKSTEDWGPKGVVLKEPLRRK
jgi:16S rRNA (cytosine1402-N4)-methyltransferase